MTTTNPNLMQYRVLLNEEHSPTFQTVFNCMAEDDDHAQEQAENAYPGCEINTVSFDMSPVKYVLFSQEELSKSDDSAGFWSDANGWTTNLVVVLVCLICTVTLTYSTCLTTVMMTSTKVTTCT